MNWFGEPWGAAINVDCERTATPTSPCDGCGEPIEPGDRGVVMPGYPTAVALHLECHLRTVTGSVGHQMGACACYGGTSEDPPWLTRREAARAAVGLYLARNNRGSVVDVR